MIRHFTATAIIINDKKQVLLVQHKKLNSWFCPGGHIDENELPDVAAVREVKEETGLDVEVISPSDDNYSHSTQRSLPVPYAIIEETVSKENGGHYHINMFYFCRIKEGGRVDFKMNENECGGIGFFGLKEIEALEMWPNFRHFMKLVLGEFSQKKRRP